MTPLFMVTADGNDVTKVLKARLAMLRVTDEAGSNSDTAEIRLDDRDGRIALPRKGAVLSIHMGYKETGLGSMGRFVVDEIELSGPPALLTIRARAADMRSVMKAPKTRSFDGITIGGLVRTLAAEYGLKPYTSADLEKVLIPHLDQADESDLHLLTRLAKEFDAVAKPAGGYLLFVARSGQKSASGKAMPEVPLAFSDLERWRVTMADRGKYASVIARWHDSEDTGGPVEVRAGQGEPVYTIRRIYPDEVSARSAAAARLAAFARGKAVLRASVAGDVRLAAEGAINISGAREGISGKWLLARVSHVIDESGYRCHLVAEAPKE